MLINKNRNRQKPSFANINLLGKCNADCYFCLGKDITTELHDKDQLNIHFSLWQNFEKFLMMCHKAKIKKIYFTGQTADGLQYKYLKDAVKYLQLKGFKVGIRTNGYLAEQKIDVITSMDAGIGYSIHSLNKETNYTIMGSHIQPDWDKIIPLSGNKVRVSIVLCRYNLSEFFSLVKYISKFDNVRYIQVRRISTDTRLKELKEDILLYEQFYKLFTKEYPSYGNFYQAHKHKLFRKEINFWRTIETNINSFNYFTDGTISDEYFIVEGYLKNRRI